MVMGVWDKDYFYLNTYCIDWKFTKFRTMKLSPAQGFLNVISRPHLIQVFPSKSPSWHIPPHLMPLYVYLDLASVLLYIHIYYRSKGFFHVLSFYENKVLVESKTFYHILHNLINKNKCVQSPCDLHQGHGHIYLHALTLHVFLDPSFHIETSIPMNSLDMSLHFPPLYCQ